MALFVIIHFEECFSHSFGQIKYAGVSVIAVCGPRYRHDEDNDVDVIFLQSVKTKTITDENVTPPPIEFYLGVVLLDKQLNQRHQKIRQLHQKYVCQPRPNAPSYSRGFPVVDNEIAHYTTEFSNRPPDTYGSLDWIYCFDICMAEY